MDTQEKVARSSIVVIVVVPRPGWLLASGSLSRRRRTTRLGFLFLVILVVHRGIAVIVGIKVELPQDPAVGQMVKHHHRIAALEAEDLRLQSAIAHPEFYKEGAEAIKAALARVETLLLALQEQEPGGNPSLTTRAACIDGLVALGRGAEVEQDAEALRRSRYLEPFTLRAIALANDDQALLEQAADSFAGLGLHWHAAQTPLLSSVRG